MKPIYDPKSGPMRVLGVCSGPGQAVWNALELQKEMSLEPEGCPFEVAGLFSDRAESPALEEAERRSLPKYLLGADDFHHGRPGEQMSEADNQAFERAMIDLLAPAGIDCLLVDGYRWTIGSYLLSRYQAVRIWPGGPACVRAFFKSGEKNLRARTTYLTAPGGVGPVLLTSECFAVDYSRFSDEKDGLRLYLKPIMELSGKTGAKAVAEIALGRFGLDEAGNLCYQGRPVPEGLALKV